MGANSGGGGGGVAGDDEESPDSSSSPSESESAAASSELVSEALREGYFHEIDKYICCNLTCATNGQHKTREGGYCNTCHQVWYCGPRCQEEAWDTHRGECESVDLKGPSIANDFWPDPVVSEAAQLGASDSTQAAAAREAGRRRKRLQGVAQVFKAQVKLVWTKILAEENDERRASLHQRMRLALHQVAVCLLLLGLGLETGKYLRRAQRDWTTSQTLSSDPTFSLYAPGWAMLPGFSRFVSRDNNVRLLRRMYGACEASNVSQRRNLGLGLLTEMDAKIEEGVLFLCPFNVVVVLYEAWVTSQTWQ